METRFRKNVYAKEPKEEKTKIEYISLSSNADEENERKYSKKGKMNYLVLGSFVSMLAFCLVIYLVFYCKPIKSLIGLSILGLLLYFLLKNFTKESYTKTIDSIRDIKALIKKKVYKEVENTDDRRYYAMNI